MSSLPPLRVGTAYDAHRLVAGRPLVLGGVTIPSERGLEGHSDADVVCHALCDAVLGAAALGDIGRHFPDSDPAYAGADSRRLLREVKKKLGSYRILNVDATILAQAPRMAPHVPQMIANIASDLGIAPGAVSIKATTTEHLGFIGRTEGIAAQAVVLIE